MSARGRDETFGSWLDERDHRCACSGCLRCFTVGELVFLRFELEKRWLRSESGRIEGNKKLPHNAKMLKRYPLEVGMSKQSHNRPTTNFCVSVLVISRVVSCGCMKAHIGPTQGQPQP
jgi:hypothetical protein